MAIMIQCHDYKTVGIVNGILQRCLNTASFAREEIPTYKSDNQSYASPPESFARPASSPSYWNIPKFPYRMSIVVIKRLLHGPEKNEGNR